MARRLETERWLVATLVERGTLDEAEARQVEEVSARTGEPVSRVLVARGSAAEVDVAAALATRLGLPYDADPKPTSAAAALVSEEVFRRHRLLPLAIEDGTLAVATADPLDSEAPRVLESATGLPSRFVVAPESSVDTGLERLLSARHGEAATEGLARSQPQHSAHYVLSRGQKVVLAAGGLACVVALALEPISTLVVLAAITILFQIAFGAYKLFLIYWGERRPAELRITDEAIERLEADIATRGPGSTLERLFPTFTILVPLYREAEVLPHLVDAIAALDYPSTKLDVKLLLEADDDETLAAARALRLRPPFRLVVVPDSEPRTKPKACNYGLMLARGDIAVIYDAEDRPEPDQLKKAAIAFRYVGPEVVCIQARLNYWNRNQNLLTAFFTAEYSHHFDMILPGLHATGAPIPLGGTSNHFRIGVLRELGAWDPFNVAEDADLGIRLARAGLQTAMMESTTYEEANSRVHNWIRQRSRWVKGYIQTWLVHMRHPVRLWRELGPRNWLSFQLIVGGTPLTLLLSPLYWILTVLWILTEASVIRKIFPGFVYFVGSFNLIVGNFVFVYLNVAGVVRRGYDNLVKIAFLSPFYWLLMSIAAWKGLVDLVRRPSHWEKTEHGLAGPPPPEVPA
jgi:cellulose synthase/poly-beta-1,6-N-acetylglucosamine synthase-like glycosyltransferase